MSKDNISVAVRRGHRLFALEEATKFAARFVQGELGAREAAHHLIQSGAFNDDAEVQEEIAKLEAAREAERQSLARICRVGTRKLEGRVARNMQEHADQHMLRAFLRVVEMGVGHAGRAACEKCSEPKAAELLRLNGVRCWHAPVDGPRWPMPEGAVFLGRARHFGHDTLDVLLMADGTVGFTDSGAPVHTTYTQEQLREAGRNFPQTEWPRDALALLVAHLGAKPCGG